MRTFQVYLGNLVDPPGKKIFMALERKSKREKKDEELSLKYPKTELLIPKNILRGTGI